MIIPYLIFLTSSPQALEKPYKSSVSLRTSKNVVIMDLILLWYRESRYLIINPSTQRLHSSSTLENWCREFARFAPSISVQTYYAGKEERIELRQTLLDSQRCKSRNGEGWEVLITTYNLAQGDDRDRKFFRRVGWDVSGLLPFLPEYHGNQRDH